MMATVFGHSSTFGVRVHEVEKFMLTVSGLTAPLSRMTENAWFVARYGYAAAIPGGQQARRSMRQVSNTSASPARLVVLALVLSIGACRSP